MNLWPRSDKIVDFYRQAGSLHVDVSCSDSIDYYASVSFESPEFTNNFFVRVAGCAAKLFDFAAAAAADVTTDMSRSDSGDVDKLGDDIDANLADARRWLDIIETPGAVPFPTDPRYVCRAKMVLTPKGRKSFNDSVRGIRELTIRGVDLAPILEDLPAESALSRVFVASACTQAAAAALFMLAARPVAILQGDARGELDNVRRAMDSLLAVRTPTLRFAD